MDIGLQAHRYQDFWLSKELQGHAYVGHACIDTSGAHCAKEIVVASMHSLRVGSEQGTKARVCLGSGTRVWVGFGSCIGLEFYS